MDTQIRSLQRKAATGDRTAHLALRRLKARLGLRSLIGMSLSFCVADILKGRVKVEEVEQIIASTTGFVVDGGRGPNYEKILEGGYLSVYWREYTREQAEKVTDQLLPLIRELPHGLPGSWVDATQPHWWGAISQGDGWGMVGTYLRFSDSGEATITDTPDTIAGSSLHRARSRDMRDAYDYEDFDEWAGEREKRHKQVLENIRASLIY